MEIQRCPSTSVFGWTYSRWNLCRGAVESSLNRRQPFPPGEGLAATTWTTGLNLTGGADGLKGGTTSTYTPYLTHT